MSNSDERDRPGASPEGNRAADAVQPLSLSSLSKHAEHSPPDVLDRPQATLSQPVAIVVLAVILGSAWAGEHLLSVRRGGPLPLAGLGAILLAGALFALLMTWSRPTTRPATDVIQRWVSIQHFLLYRVQILCWLGAATTVMVATVLGQSPHRGWIALGLWLVSIILVLTAVYSGPAKVHPWQWVRSHPQEMSAVALCMALALVLRTVRLETIPQIIIGDEASIGLEARDLLAGRIDPAFVTGWAGLPRLTFLTIAAPMWVFGQGVWGLRMHAVLVGTATILTLYWLLRAEAGLWLSQCAIWLLATYPFHLHVSRLGVNQADDSLLLTATFAALLWATRSQMPLAWAITGLCTALTLTVYPGARVVIIVLGALVVFWVFKTRGRWLVKHRAGLVIAAAAFVVGGLPMMRFYVTHWGDFNDRLNQVGIVQTGWLARQTQQTGRSVMAIVWDQFVHAFFGYSFYRDTTRFFNDPEGLLQFWPAALFPLGLAAALMYVRRRLFLLFILWILAIVGVGGALTLAPPYTTRLTGLAPALIFMVALAIVTFARLGHRLRLWGRRRSVVLTALCVVALGISGVYHYFAVYTPQYYYGDSNAELATAAGYYMQRLNPMTHAYFLGEPRMFYNFSTIEFLAPEISGVDVPPDEHGIPPSYKPAYPAFFFAIPERRNNLQEIVDRLPGGDWIEIDRVVSHEPLMYGYLLRR